LVLDIPAEIARSLIGFLRKSAEFPLLFAGTRFAPPVAGIATHRDSIVTTINTAAPTLISQLRLVPSATLPAIQETPAERPVPPPQPTTGAAPTPPLSSDVLGALLAQQTQSSSPAGQAASTTQGSSSGSSSGPLSLQQIAEKFDVHNLTTTQFENLTDSLSASANISFESQLNVAIKLGGGFQNFDALEGKAVSGPRIVGIWDGVTDDGSTFDATSKVSGWLANDIKGGFQQAASADQNILNVLNQLGTLRSGTST
jgi:hypothetical protein